jgi:nucleoside 2-deoxyribosyltransferase
MDDSWRRPRIYLAGPEVFLPQAASLGADKQRLAAAAGFEGVFPHDLELKTPTLSKREQAHRIFTANTALMRSCDALIANLTPFRGVSADAGTVFELGFMSALGRPVSAYSNAARNYHARATAFRARHHSPEEDCDRVDCEVEDHDLNDNLMLEMAVIQSGSRFLVQERAAIADMTDLRLFERCLELLRPLFFR